MNPDIYDKNLLIHFYIENRLYYHLHDLLSKESQNMSGSGITSSITTAKNYITSALQSILEKKIDKDRVDNNLRQGAIERKKHHKSTLKKNKKKSKSNTTNTTNTKNTKKPKSNTTNTTNTNSNTINIPDSSIPKITSDKIDTQIDKINTHVDKIIIENVKKITTDSINNTAPIPTSTSAPVKVTVVG